MGSEHGLLLFLSPELSIGLVKYQAKNELGRSYAGLSLLTEALFRNNCISQDVYERHREKYSIPLVPKVNAEPKLLTLKEQKEKAIIADLERQFSGALSQWETLTPKARAAHVANARNYVGIVSNAKMILDLEDPLEVKEGT